MSLAARPFAVASLLALALVILSFNARAQAPRVYELDRIVAVVVVENERIDVRIAAHDIVTGPADQSIIPGPTIKNIITGPAVQHVAVCVAKGAVISRATPDGVMARAAFQAATVPWMPST